MAMQHHTTQPLTTPWVNLLLIGSIGFALQACDNKNMAAKSTTQHH